LIPRILSKEDFLCKKEHVAAKLHAGIDRLYTGFQNELSAPGAEQELARRIGTLDPTQHLVYVTVSQWAEERLRWRESTDFS
jgi:hypothetical protein